MSSAANSAGSSLPPLGEQEIARRVAAERARLEQAAGLTGKPVEHFHRPRERPFTAEERDRVTILFGGFTWKHERLIEAVFRGCGYRFQMLPNPNLAAFQTGKEYGNNGQCNPTYFTVGNLIEFLRSLEAQGLSRQEIIDNYIFSPPAPAALAASACTSPSIGWRWRMRASVAFAYCFFSRTRGSRPALATPA